MGRYIGTTELRQYLSPDDSLGTLENGLLNSCVLRSEQAIDSYTRRSFATVAGTRYYTRHNVVFGREKRLYLDDDLYALHRVYNGDSSGTIPIGSIWTEPRNEGPPYRILQLKSSQVWVFATDGEITIAGGWGYSGTAPDDIVQASVRYAAYLYRQKDVGPGDIAGFQESGEVKVAKGLPDDVKYLLAPYRSRTGGIV